MSGHLLTFNLYARGDASLFPPLPLLIVNSEQKELHRLTLIVGMPYRKKIEFGDLELFAVLRLPTGRAQVQPLEEDGVVKASVDFFVGSESPHEWMAWSTMRTDLQRSVAPLMRAPGMEGAWVQLWELSTDKWGQVPLLRDHISFDVEGMQLELGASRRPRALMVHLGLGIPQVISLPRQRRVMALLTRAHTSGTSESPRMVIGGYGGSAEALLEFLRKGALGIADAALDPGSELANQLLYDKIVDPLAATASAYYLMRKRDWERMPQQWLANLAKWFPHIPDATLIRDASLIERGMDVRAASTLAARSLKSALSRGLPLFAEAASLMNDLFLYAQKDVGPDQLTEEQLDFVRRLLAAFQPAGLTFGFYGRSPHQPVVAQAARRAALAVDLQRQVADVGTKVFSGLVGLVDPGPTRIRTVSRALTVAIKGVTDVLADLADKRPAAPGDSSQTLFMKDLYQVDGQKAPEDVLAALSRHRAVLLLTANPLDCYVKALAEIKNRLFGRTLVIPEGFGPTRTWYHRMLDRLDTAHVAHMAGFARTGDPPNEVLVNLVVNFARSLEYGSAGSTDAEILNSTEGFVDKLVALLQRQPTR